MRIKRLGVGNNIFVVGVVILVVIIGLFFAFQGDDESIEVDTNFTQKLDSEERVEVEFDPSKIMSGGPPKDGIPSIDNPEFVSVDDADSWIQDNELVLGLNYNGIQKVYPLQIMVWHEIVNDFVAGDAILITYCPLCGSGIAYYRTLAGEVVEFGTSGKLYNSNLIMYDRKTDSYWTQIDGLAVTGEMKGIELEPVLIHTVNWLEWKEAYPDSLVLSQNTGFNRDYGRDPYGSYYEEDFLFFPVEVEDDRIHAKEVIFGIEIDGKYKAYLEKDLIAQGEIEDEFGETNIFVQRKKSGEVLISNIDTDEEIVYERDFWFAWYAFHPKTDVYQN